MFYPFSVPIGLGSFELLSLSRSHQFRRIPDLAPRAPMSGYIVCFQTRCRHRELSDREQTKHIVDASLCDAEDQVPKFLPRN
ncbi:hypothetical protein TNCV_986951 [Trichonephila clavipes]|nr:hypothetical protein TNCV_986951 [Trichonephila clavipes]